MQDYFKRDYARQWYSYGLDTKNDKIIKFIMHWIAFNWLYGEASGGSERDNIANYCAQHKVELADYDAFNAPEIAVFLEKPVHDARSEHKYRPKQEGKRRDIRDEIFDVLVDEKAENSDRIAALLLTCYQVRCNLFHGQKRLCNARDVSLVENSSVILEGYLNAVLNYNKRYRFGVK